MGRIYEYPEDLKRLQGILADRGYEATLDDCEKLWSKYSDSMAATWMMMDNDSDDQVFDCVSFYITN